MRSSKTLMIEPSGEFTRGLFYGNNSEIKYNHMLCGKLCDGKRYLSELNDIMISPWKEYALTQVGADLVRLGGTRRE